MFIVVAAVGDVCYSDDSNYLVWVRKVGRLKSPPHVPNICWEISDYNDLSAPVVSFHCNFGPGGGSQVGWQRISQSRK